MGENGMGMSASDAIALTKDNNDFMGSGMGAFWIFALLLLNNGGFGGYGNRGGLVTEGELAASQNAQTSQMMLDGIQGQIANAQYANAQAVNDQTNLLIQQNNTNLVNAIQGFNNIGLQITNQTNQLAAQMQQMSAHLDECCCSIKTQMLQDKLDAERAKTVELQNQISNLNQTQTILNTMGRFVAWSGSGTQGAAAAAG